MSNAAAQPSPSGREGIDRQLPQDERLASCNAPPDHRVIQHGSLAHKEDVCYAAAPI
jgi:hypothetical protein